MPVMVVQVIRPDVPGTLEWKIQRLHNPSDGKISSFVEIDLMSNPGIEDLILEACRREPPER